MLFLLDENISGNTGALLKSLGHRFERVPLGLSDTKIASMARESKLILITRDEDFLHYIPSPRWGIIYIHIHPSIAEHITLAVEKLLKSTPSTQLFGKTMILSRGGFEVFG